VEGASGLLVKPGGEGVAQWRSDAVTQWEDRETASNPLAGWLPGHWFARAPNEH
jgi:hypothetical protein